VAELDTCVVGGELPVDLALVFSELTGLPSKIQASARVKAASRVSAQWLAGVCKASARRR